MRSMQTRRRWLRRSIATPGRALELLEQAVEINSGTMNFAGVRRVGELFIAELDELGFDTAWEPGEAYGRAGHLIAVREARGPQVLLIGHLDTVFPADSPFQHFERVDERFARGPGITDMKGGNVVMLEALRALAEAGLLDELSVTIVLTGDEESSGEPLALARQIARRRGRPRRLRDRLRGRRRQSRDGRGRAARQRRLGADGERQGGAFLADIPAGLR